MVLDWREREHEDMDQDALWSAPIMHALQQSGLLKFFCTSPMLSNVCLLEFLINYWDHDLGEFDLQGEILEITLEDIYFISGLSQRGASVNFEGTSRGCELLSVQNYIDTYCVPGMRKKGTCIPIVHIQSFPLQVLVSTIVRVAGSSSLRLATRKQMIIVVECLQGSLFDWCSGVILIMKKQLSDYNRSRHKKFG